MSSRKPRAKKAPATEPTPTGIVAYKGFDASLACRGFRYEIGKTFSHDGKVVRCASGGFHSCEMPLDVWNYYGPVTSRFADVLVGGAIDRPAGEDTDTKIASAQITIRAELKLPDLVRRAIEWIIAKADKNVTTGYRSHAASTGDSSHAASTGNYSHAASTGDSSHAAST
ncbi:MAG: hypothetical protein HYU59_05685, partial [Magnetospirillum gryphiswaldense]|nr:hypothetical protein [Magnetospirillum gryphiswaldense]